MRSSAVVLAVILEPSMNSAWSCTATAIVKNIGSVLGFCAQPLLPEPASEGLLTPPLNPPICPYWSNLQMLYYKDAVRYAPYPPTGHTMAGTPVDHLQELLSKLDEHIKQQQTKKALRTADSSESSLPP